MNVEEACRIFARAWNLLSPEILIDALDEDVCYTSQWVWTSLNGKEEFAGYLRPKMETVRHSPEAKVFAQLAMTQPYAMYPNPPQPCVVVSQGTPQNMMATVLFTTSETGISTIDMCCIPPPETTRLSGEFPA